VVEALTHRYGERTALNNVSFQVAKGEIFRSARAEWRGKTTLFRILSTLVAPSEGSVRMFGVNVVREQSEIRRRIGVVFNHRAWTAN